MKKTLLLISLFFTGISAVYSQSDGQYKDSFNLDSCTFASTGKNTYFILEPGYQLTYKGKEDGEEITLIITVLNETKIVSGIETRIVEERESSDGELYEVSRNYFAVCKETNDIYYFGEDVDEYEDGKITGHSGTWKAEGKNKPGLIMPGNPSAGLKYYQEIAPGIAMDRAEILSVSETIVTPAGKFGNVLKTEETSSLDPKDKSFKFYAPDVGLIRDGDLPLVKYGFVDFK
jgi:hypothetical protein